MTALLERPEPVSPTESEAKQAAASAILLAREANKHRKSIRVRIGQRDVTIPISAFRLLANILSETAKGNAVTLIPIHAELTTQRAADLLNVSRPYLVRLIEEGQLPAHKVGTHRRVRFDDLMRYKRTNRAARLKALEELTAMDQELDLGY